MINNAELLLSYFFLPMGFDLGIHIELGIQEWQVTGRFPHPKTKIVGFTSQKTDTEWITG